MKSGNILTASELISTLDQTGVVNLGKLTDLIIARLCWCYTFCNAGHVVRAYIANGKAVRGFLLAHGFDSNGARIAWENARDLVKLENNAHTKA